MMVRRETSTSSGHWSASRREEHPRSRTVGRVGHALLQEALRQHQVNRAGFEVVMTPELERLLDEGVENPDQAKTTEELREQR